MPTWRTVQNIARTLPETTEGPQYDKSSLRVGGKAFLIRGGDETFSIITDDRDVMLQSSPDIYESIPHHVGTKWVVVRLARISEEELREIMADAWRIRAPRRLIKANPAI